MAMTVDEVRKAFDILRKQGKTDEEIIVSVFLMFKDGNITNEEFYNLLEILGYGLKEEFKKMPIEKQKDPNVFFSIKD